MKVFFYQRSTHRKRQRETVEHCPPSIEALKPEDVSFIKDTVLSNRRRNKKLRIKSVLSKFVPMNTHKMKDAKAKEADFVYTWACIPRGIDCQYVLEMDNPYCVSYYNLTWFKVLKPLIKRILLSKRNKQIVCISEACKNSIEVELGKAIADKTTVVYPYIADHKNMKASKMEDAPTEFLFVSTQFCLKGGREVIEAGKRLFDQGYNFHITMITHLDEVKEEYRNLPFIEFHEANIDKEVLHKIYFSRADVFLLPSYQDSFGMVYLEALSFGLPIIATDMYAIPEMVQDQRNGYLVDLPVLFYLDNYQLNPKYKNGNILDDILAVPYFATTAAQVETAMKTLCNRRSRTQMAAESSKLFDEKFSEEVRNSAFAGLFGL